MRTADFDYHLPPELIAQSPVPHRDQSRLFVVHRAQERFEHRRFSELPCYLRHGDVLVANDSRVIPARLWAVKPESGGQAEILLLEQTTPTRWFALLRPGKRVRPGTQLHIVRRPIVSDQEFSDAASGAGSSTTHPDSATAPCATVVLKKPDGRCLVEFSGIHDMQTTLTQFGEVPLPPYIDREKPPSNEDRERYQTVYALRNGSVAAPTAGLHFTEPLLNRLKELGVEVCFLTLHVGLATFAPVKAARLENHIMHSEPFDLPESTAEAVNVAKRTGGRVIAVGTTVTRVLESVAANACESFDTKTDARPRRSLDTSRSDLLPSAGCRGRTSLFIYPPYKFRVVDVLLTNFHLPKSTLLMLVSAMAAPGEIRGRDLILAAYSEAVQQRYRFYSYGDAMLII